MILHTFRRKYTSSLASIFEANIKLSQNPAVQEDQIGLLWDRTFKRKTFRTDSKIFELSNDVQQNFVLKSGSARRPPDNDQTGGGKFLEFGFDDCIL